MRDLGGMQSDPSGTIGSTAVSGTPGEQLLASRQELSQSLIVRTGHCSPPWLGGGAVASVTNGLGAAGGQ